METNSEGDTRLLSAPLKEGNTHPLSDDYYIKSICPSGGHGRGHRLEESQGRIGFYQPAMSSNSARSMETALSDLTR